MCNDVAHFIVIKRESSAFFKKVGQPGPYIRLFSVHGARIAVYNKFAIAPM